MRHLARTRHWTVVGILLAIPMLLAVPPTCFAGAIKSEVPGDVYILSVGINQYPRQSGLDSHIMFAEADASALPAALEKWIKEPEAHDVAAKLLPTVRVYVTTLLGPKATIDGIRSAMQQIARSARPGDVFIFNFDGMGVCETTHANYEFAAYDSVKTDDGSWQNALRARDLGALLTQIPATEQFVILDTCGSHRALDDLRVALQPPGTDFKYLWKQVHLFAPDGASRETVETKHGLLTAAFLDGLAGGADVDHSGRITWDRLVGYVTWKLPESDKEDMANAERLYALTIYGDASPAKAPTRALTPVAEDAAPDPNDIGQDYALLVGTDHYSGDWPTLNNPISDVKALREELVRDYGFRNDDDHIIEIDEAGKSDIAPKIHQLMAKKFRANDRLLVYFAGHGYRTYLGGKNLEGYVVFRGSKNPTDDDATDSMMSFSDLSAQLNSIGVQHLLLVMDVCYGGLFDGTTDHVKTSFLSLLGGNEQDTAPASELMRRALAAPSRIYITSGDENHQVSDGEKGQHSPFSGRFISVLQANAKSRPYLDMAFLLNGLRSLPREPKAGYFYAAHVDLAQTTSLSRGPNQPQALLPRPRASEVLRIYFWQVGQEWVPRSTATIFLMGVAQTRHRSPTCQK